MIEFEKIRFKNFLSFGNTMTEIDFKKSPMTLLSGRNGVGKCFSINTLVRVKNTRTNVVTEMTIGEFYETQKKQIE